MGNNHIKFVSLPISIRLEDAVQYVKSLDYPAYCLVDGICISNVNPNSVADQNARREAIAMAAMNGMFAAGHMYSKIPAEAVEYADALIDALDEHAMS